MLTPRFELTQNDDEVIINIYARYANIKDTEVYVEKTDFCFSSPPYYLRLKLPGEIIENDESKGSYDCDSGIFTLKFSKIKKGENFDNLDMITTLLAPPNEKKELTPTIEIIGNPIAEHVDGVDPISNSQDNQNNDYDNEWFIQQVPPTQNPSDILQNSPKYGFAHKISGALISFDAGFLRDVVDLPFPDSTPISQRRILRESDENDHFNEDHYMADLIQTEETSKPCILFEPEWYKLTEETIELTDKEKDILKELPNKEYLLDNEEKKIILMSMIDIIFASCYTHRINFGEYSSESSWDINKISATLSWFQNYNSIDDVIITSIRRSLTYPLYRNWDLSIKIFEDVKQIIKLGKKMILKIFCKIYELFNNSFEPRYILNQLYIKDYLIWLQNTNNSLILSLYNDIDSLIPKKENINFDLIELETAAWSVIDDENEILKNNFNSSDDNLIIENSIINKFEKIIINDDSSDISDDSDSDSSTSYTSSTCSTSTSSTSTTTDSEFIQNNKNLLINQIKKNNEQLDSDDCTDSDDSDN